ncbi:MAG: trypsin-like peptidase domain-containing protein [Pseudomonadota bacterium]
MAARIQRGLPDSQLSSIGTGFFYQASLNDGTNRSITFLISNKHVFFDLRGTLTISLNERSEDNAPVYGKVMNFEKANFSSIYYEHIDSDVDLACVNASEISHKNAFYRTLNDEFLEQIDYSKLISSQKIIFVGYPDGRYDVINNLPLVRAGSIASLPSVDFNGKGQIVIDAQVFQGSSGSPVFVAYDGRYYLLGVITETMIRHSMLQTVPSNLSGIGVQQILGLGIVIKQRHVRELIDGAVKEFLARNTAS